MNFMETRHTLVLGLATVEESYGALDLDILGIT